MRLGIPPLFSENVHDEKLAYNSLGRRLDVTSTFNCSVILRRKVTVEKVPVAVRRRACGCA